MEDINNASDLKAFNGSGGQSGEKPGMDKTHANAAIKETEAAKNHEPPKMPAEAPSKPNASQKAKAARKPPTLVLDSAQQPSKPALSPSKTVPIEKAAKPYPRPSSKAEHPTKGGKQAEDKAAKAADPSSKAAAATGAKQQAVAKPASSKPPTQASAKPSPKTADSMDRAKASALSAKPAASASPKPTPSQAKAKPASPAAAKPAEAKTPSGKASKPAASASPKPAAHPAPKPAAAAPKPANPQTPKPAARAAQKPESASAAKPAAIERKAKKPAIAATPDPVVDETRSAAEIASPKAAMQAQEPKPSIKADNKKGSTQSSAQADADSKPALSAYQQMLAASAKRKAEVAEIRAQGEFGGGKLVVLAAFCAVYAGLEVLAYALDGPLSVAASRVFIAGWIFNCGLGIFAFAKSIREDALAKRIPLFAGLILAAMALSVIPASAEIQSTGNDALRQLEWGIQSYKAADWNYFGRSLSLDYPARQYLISSMPALALGLTPAAVKLGFSLPFVFGLIILYTGLRKRMKSPAMALAAISLVFAFPSVAERYMSFGHALFPVSFCMMALGWLLMFIDKPSLANAFCLIWACCLMPSSYAPALAALALLVIFLIVLGFSTHFSIDDYGLEHFRVKAEQGTALPLCLFMAAIPILFTFISLSGQFDKLTSLGSGDLLQQIRHSFEAFFFGKGAAYAGTAATLVIVYFIAAISTKLGAYNFFIAVWIVMVVALASVLRGVSLYGFPEALSRTMVAIPVIAVAISLTAQHLLQKRRIDVKNWVFYSIAFFNIGTLSICMIA